MSDFRELLAKQLENEDFRKEYERIIEMEQMTVLSTEKRLCLSCMEVHEVQTVQIREHNTFKGVQVEYEARYYYCTNADELLSDEKMSNENFEAMKKAYEDKVGEGLTS